MARVITSGIETQTASAVTSGMPDGQAVNGAAVNTTNPRSGLACASFPGSGAVPSRTWSFTGALSTSYYTRVYFSKDVDPTIQATILAIGNDARVKLGTDGTLTLWADATLSEFQVGSESAATPIGLGLYFMVELMVFIGVGSTDAVELRLDGVMVARSDGLNLSDSAPGFLQIGWITGPGNTPTLLADDVAMNDSNGSANNTWCGDGKVVMLYPVSDNARVGWTNAAAGTTNLFQDVDNTPPVGVASPAAQPAQIKVTTNNTTDTYDANIQSYGSAGIAPNDEINAVVLLANHGYSFAAAATLGLQGISNPVQAEVTDVTNGSAAGAYPSNWAWVTKTIDAPSGLLLNTQPVLRIRHGTASNSRSQFVDAMGILVDYTPQPGSVSYANWG